jgi:general secretion pathway protein E/type IV pilus assembly protein PilB
MPLVRQTSVQEEYGLGFSQGIRSMMRQDPDVILVGEIRDEPTATMAVRAAMTGHKIFSTLHSNDAIGAIPRLVDIGIAPTLLGGTIIGILAQRLVRKLCEACKRKDEWTSFEVDLLVPIFGTSLPDCYRPKEGGCPSCHHMGYAGRLVVAEMILMDDTMDRLICESATRSRMLEALREQNFCFLIDDALKKMGQGLTDLEAISHVVDITKRL